MPIQCTCPVCGKAFTRVPAKIRQANFCSLSCRNTKPPAKPEISPDGLTARIPLFNRDGAIISYVTVDSGDAEFVSKHRWHLSVGRYASRRDMTAGNRPLILLHRELLGLSLGDGLEVDHINRITTDNRRSNLRIVTRQLNTQNLPSRKGSTSKYRGVHWCSAANRWQAGLYLYGKRIHLGNFKDEDEAGAAARSGRLRLLPGAVD